METAAAAGPEAGSGSSAPQPLPADSLYQLTSEWEDPQGETSGLDLFRGHPVLIALFFGSCDSACPVLVHDLERLEASLPAAEREALRVLLVTLDPENDTAERLAAYAREQGFPAARWRLLRGDPAAVRELAAVLGVRYRPIPGGQIQHSMRITLLDPQGVIAHQLDGPSPDPEPLASRIAGWVSG
jgi:protein SCO1/2